MNNPEKYPEDGAYELLQFAFQKRWALVDPRLCLPPGIYNRNLSTGNLERTSLHPPPFIVEQQKKKEQLKREEEVNGNKRQLEDKADQGESSKKQKMRENEE